MSGSSLIALIHRTALALALGLLPSIARASEPAPSDPVFTVHLIDGKTLSGQLRQLGPNDRLTLVPSDGPDRVMPLDQVVKIIRDGPPVVFSTELPVVLLPDGERVFKPVVGKTKDMAIEVRHYVLGDLSIPLDSLVGLVYDSRPAAEPEGADLFLDRVPSDPRIRGALAGQRRPIGGQFSGVRRHEDTLPDRQWDLVTRPLRHKRPGISTPP